MNGAGIHVGNRKGCFKAGNTCLVKRYDLCQDNAKVTLDEKKIMSVFFVCNIFLKISNML